MVETQEQVLDKEDRDGSRPDYTFSKTTEDIPEVFWADRNGHSLISPPEDPLLCYHVSWDIYKSNIKNTFPQYFYLQGPPQNIFITFSIKT